MARADKWMEPYGNTINPVTKMPIYGDPVSLVGAGASIIGGLASSSASSDAASAQQQAANDATNAQLQMFNTVNSQQAPYRQAGRTALNALLYGSGLSGLPGGNSGSSSAQPLTYAQWAAQQPHSNNPMPTGALYGGGAPGGIWQAYLDNLSNPGYSAPTQADYQKYVNNFNASNANNTSSSTNPNIPGIGFGDLTHQFNANDLGTNLSPSYNFMLSQGLGALQNSQAAQGGLVGGNALRGINDYAQNYASTGYQQAFNNYTANQSNIFNRLSDIAGLGQTANQQTAQTASAFAPGIAGTIQGAGQAAASGIVGSTNALTGGLNNALGWYQLGNLGGSPTFGSGGGNTAPGISLASNTPIGNY